MEPTHFVICAKDFYGNRTYSFHITEGRVAKQQFLLGNPELRVIKRVEIPAMFKDEVRKHANEINAKDGYRIGHIRYRFDGKVATTTSYYPKSSEEILPGAGGLG